MEASAEADLIVIGATRQRAHFGLQLGRAAHALLHHSQCPAPSSPSRSDVRRAGRTPTASGGERRPADIGVDVGCRRVDPRGWACRAPRLPHDPSVWTWAPTAGFRFRRHGRGRRG
ncbi:universal stress protein [Streptomyces sp. GLT-R25]